MNVLKFGAIISNYSINIAYATSLYTIICICRCNFANYWTKYEDIIYVADVGKDL